MSIRGLGLRGFVAAALLPSVVGCASFTHLTRVKSVPEAGENASVILIDAKQRAILSAYKPATNGTDKSTATPAAIVQCAEPSPDAISALTASAGSSLSVEDKVNLASNLALSEGVASIGLRTQSIQLMRDSMYRLCEGYLSGAIDGPAFETLHRRMQSSMVAILAIEQLTGVIRPPAVIIGGESASGAAEEITKLTDMTAAARKSVTTAEKASNDATTKSTAATAVVKPLEDDYTTKQKAAEAAGATDAVKTAATEAKKKLDDAKAADKDAKGKAEAAAKDLEDAKKQLDFLEKSLVAVQGGHAGAAAKGEIEAATRTASPSAVDSVATTVGTIVSSTLELGFTRELCTTLFLRNATAEIKADSGSVLAGCAAYLKATADGQTALVTINNAKAKIYQTVADKLQKGEITLKEATTMMAELSHGTAPTPTEGSKPLKGNPTE